MDAYTCIFTYMTYTYIYISVDIFFHFSMCMYKRPRTCGTNHRVYVCTYIMEARSNFFRDPLKMFLHPLILVIAHRGSLSVLVDFDCARLARRDHKTANQRAPEYEIALRKRIRWRVKRDHRSASIFFTHAIFSSSFSLYVRAYKSRDVYNRTKKRKKETMA